MSYKARLSALRALLARLPWLPGRRRRWSIVAISETVFASTFVVVLCAITQSLWPVLGPSIVAPFLLLRTSYSMRIGVSLFCKVELLFQIRYTVEVIAYCSVIIGTLVWIAVVAGFGIMNWTTGLEVVTLAVGSWADIIWMLVLVIIGIISLIVVSAVILPPLRIAVYIVLLGVYVVLVSALIMAIRIIATVIAAMRRPLHTCRAVPRNWRKIAGQTTAIGPVAIVPGLGKHDSEEDFSVRGFLKAAGDIFDDEAVGIFLSESDSDIVTGCLLTIPVLIVHAVVIALLSFVLYGLPFVYRLSLKSSSLVYFVFLGISGCLLSSKHGIALVRQAAEERRSLHYAYTMVAANVILPVAVVGQLRVMTASWPSTAQTFLGLFIAVPFTEIHLAHILSAFAIMMSYYGANGILKTKESGDDHGRKAEWVFRLLAAIRAVIALYLIMLFWDHLDVWSYLQSVWDTLRSMEVDIQPLRPWRRSGAAS